MLLLFVFRQSWRVICVVTISGIYFYTAKAQGLGCLNHNLSSALPPTPNTKVELDSLLPCVSRL